MTTSELVEFEVALTMVMQMVGDRMGADAVSAYASLFQEYSLHECKAALSKATLENRGKIYPVDIMKHLKPKTPTDRQNAVDVMGLIRQSISRHGWPWPEGVREDDKTVFYGVKNGVRSKFLTWAEAARHELGDLALETIRRKYGTWKTMCENLDAIDSANDAQARDVAEMLQVKAAIGNIHEPPSLPINKEIKKLLDNFKSIDTI